MASFVRMVAVLVVTGPVGVGKTTVLHEADRLLIDAKVPHATVELEEIAGIWPMPDDWRARRRVAFRNLASLWGNYQAAGADRLLLGMLFHRGRSDLLPVRRAIPTADITVVQLRAPLELIEGRLRAREASESSGEQEVSGARWWVRRLERSPVGDYIVDNHQRSPEQVAREVLQLAGWL